MALRTISFAAVLWALSVAYPASAALYVADLVDGVNALPIPGNQAWPGQLGDDFTTTSAISISRVGVFDDDGDGTVGDLVWQLFSVQSGALVHQETVAATGARVAGSDIAANYVWLDLATPVILPAGQTYSAVASGFGANDRNFNTNFDLANLDVVFSTDGIVAAGGRYSNAPSGSLPTIGAANSASNQAYNFGAASFDYSVVPEASTMAIWCLLSCTVGTGAWIRRRYVGV